MQTSPFAQHSLPQQVCPFGQHFEPVPCLQQFSSVFGSQQSMPQQVPPLLPATDLARRSRALPSCSSPCRTASSSGHHTLPFPFTQVCFGAAAFTSAAPLPRAARDFDLPLAEGAVVEAAFARPGALHLGYPRPGVVSSAGLDPCLRPALCVFPSPMHSLQGGQQPASQQLSASPQQR